MVDNHELATYLWDNHLQVNDANHIFFVGIGAAHADMLWIITQQGSWILCRKLGLALTFRISGSQ